MHPNDEKSTLKTWSWKGGVEEKLFAKTEVCCDLALSRRYGGRRMRGAAELKHFDINIVSNWSFLELFYWTFDTKEVFTIGITMSTPPQHSKLGPFLP